MSPSRCEEKRVIHTSGCSSTFPFLVKESAPVFSRNMRYWCSGVRPSEGGGGAGYVYVLYTRENVTARAAASFDKITTRPRRYPRRIQDMVGRFRGEREKKKIKSRKRRRSSTPVRICDRYENTGYETLSLFLSLRKMSGTSPFREMYEKKKSRYSLYNERNE